MGKVQLAVDGGLQDERVTVYAKGQPLGSRKRLEIARALATEPELLLLDEACAGLNPSELDTSIGIIRKIKERGITIMIIEHHIKVIMSISDRIVVLTYGQKLAEGTPAEISGNDQVIKAYLGESDE
jgi:branched-chain amino acid transport system ATP-binding protein